MIVGMGCASDIKPDVFPQGGDVGGCFDVYKLPYLSVATLAQENSSFLTLRTLHKSFHLLAESLYKNFLSLAVAFRALPKSRFSGTAQVEVCKHRTEVFIFLPSLFTSTEYY